MSLPSSASPGPRPCESITLYAALHSSDMRVVEEGYRTLWSYLLRMALAIVHDQSDAQDLAEDCAQEALVRVYRRLHECREAAALCTWAGTIVRHLVIDELKRQGRIERIEDLDLHGDPPETSEIENGGDRLRRAILRAPISPASRRVVVGRYFDDIPDERLAQIESELTGRETRPSHIQVTRARDIKKLRGLLGGVGGPNG